MRSPLLLLALITAFVLPQKAQTQCPVGQTQAELTITTFSFATEIFWKLTDGNGVLVDSVAPITYPSNGTIYDPTYIPEHTQCLDDNAIYNFETYDSFGDSWNGSLYEWNKSCTGQTLINNNGLSPDNGIGGFIPNDLESVEPFSVNPCLADDLTLLSGPAFDENCGGDFYLDLTIKNIGLNTADSFFLTAIINNDTIDTLVVDSLISLQDTVISLGPFALTGSSTGINYPVTAWVRHTPDTVTLNDSLLGFSLAIFENSPFAQTRTFNPVIGPDNNGYIRTEIPFCNSGITVIDSCFKIASITIDSLWTAPLNNFLEFRLISPSGTSLLLNDLVGGLIPNVHGVGFSDTATTQLSGATLGYPSGFYMPIESPGLPKFYGEDPNGHWTLEIYEPIASGFPALGLQQWSLVFDQSPILDLGPDTDICPGDTLTLDAGLGQISYNWSTSATGTQISVVNPNTYSVTTEDVFGCDQIDSVIVDWSDTIVSGQLMSSFNLPMQNATVYLIEHDVVQNTISAFDSTYPDTQGYFEIAVSKSPFWVKVAPDSAFYPNQMPTYFGDELLFVNADSLQGTATCDTAVADITTILGINPGGLGFLGGFLSQGANKDQGPGDPVPHQGIFLINSQSEPVQYRATDASGHFSFEGLPEDTYEFWVDIPVVDNAIAPTINLTHNPEGYADLDLRLHSNYLEIFWSIGIGEHEAFADVQVYPNPTKDLLTIDFQETELSFETIVLTNNIGQTVLEKNLNGHLRYTLEVGQLQRGIYQVSLQGASGTMHRSVLVH